MAESKFGEVLGQICNLIDSRAASKLSDRQLLEMFIARRDAGAFEALLRRYGRLVLSICRRRLSRAEDIEDAFQATFVVLVRKATAIRQSELLGSWLYGVPNASPDGRAITKDVCRTGKDPSPNRPARIRRTSRLKMSWAF